MDIMTALSLASGIHELAKTAVEARDARLAQDAIAEIRDRQIALRGVLLDLQEKAHAQLQRAEAAEKQLAELREWKRDAEKYELKDVGNGVLAYAIRPSADDVTPAHSLCPDCYQSFQKSILQTKRIDVGRAERLECQKCGWSGYVRGAASKDHPPVRTR